MICLPWVVLLVVILGFTYLGYLLGVIVSSRGR